MNDKMKTFPTALILLMSALFFFRCTGYSSKEGKAYYDGEEITRKDLVMLSGNFAKDSTQCYYREKPIRGSDPITFQVLDENYAKDKQQVYFCSDNKVGAFFSWTRSDFREINTVENALPSSFIAIGHGYAKDGLRAYFAGKVFKVEEPASLNALSEDFTRDNKRAYFQTRKIIGSDGRSFTLLAHDALSGYAIDAKFAYYFSPNGVRIIPCKRKTFNVIQQPYSKDDNSVFYENKKLPNVDLNGFQILNDTYSKDSRSFYFEDKKIDGTNFNDFVILEGGFSKSATEVYFHAHRLPMAKPNSFHVLRDGYATDGQLVFFQNHQLVGADAIMFQAEGAGRGSDGRTTYKYGEKVNK